MAGYTSSIDGDLAGVTNQITGSYWIVKLDATDRHILWQFRYGGTSNDYPTSGAQTTDGGFVIFGYSSSTTANGNPTGNHGNRDYWVIKLNSAGLPEWQKSLGGANSDEGQSIDQTFDGGYIMAGRSTSEDGDISSGDHRGGWDIWVAKLAPDPNPGQQLPIATTSTVTKNIPIPGDNPIELNDGSNKMVRLTPTRGVNALTGNVSTKVFIDGNLPTVNQPVVERYYEITPAANANTAQATITLYFRQQEFDNFNAFASANPNLQLPQLPSGPNDHINKSNLRIKQYPGTFVSSSDPSFTIVPNNVIWDNGNSCWIVIFNVSHFSRFYLTSGNTILPLTFLEFKGRLQENKILLQWLTKDEVNTKEFVIEHSNQNTAFSAIGTVSAQSTPGAHHYNFTHTRYLAGNNYYRLKTIDKDGKSTYSNIVQIKISSAVYQLSAFPNPTKNILNVKIVSAGNSKITLVITNLNGKQLFNKTVNVSNGESIMPLNIAKLQAGTYFLKILSADGQENVVKKFVIQ